MRSMELTLASQVSVIVLRSLPPVSSSDLVGRHYVGDRARVRAAVSDFFSRRPFCSKFVGRLLATCNAPTSIAGRYGPRRRLA
jgi:hypothetical protein